MTKKISISSIIFSAILFGFVIYYVFAEEEPIFGFQSFSPFFITSTSTNSGVSTTTAAQLRRPEWVIGIGTSTPIGKFTIHSTTDDLLPYHFFVASSTLTATTTVFVIRNNGNIGVATSVPASLFSVGGTGLFNNLLVDLDIGESTNRVANIYANNGDFTTITIGSFALGDLTVRSDLFVNGNDFNLGSGTATSTYLGTGTSTMQAGFSFAGGGVASSRGLTLTGGIIQSSGNFNITSSATSTFTTSGLSVAGGGLASSKGLVITGGNTLITSGDLGIGTTTPAARLSVNGPTFFDSPYIRYGSSTAPNLNFRYFASSTSTIPNLTSAFTYATSTTNTPLLTLSTKSSRYGRVGIGTSSPSALFAINALNSSNQADNLFYIGSSTQNTFVIDNHGNIGIGTSTRSTSKARLAITGFGTGTNRILALADANNNEVLTVQENGNVGIGTAGPTELLHLKTTNPRLLFEGAAASQTATIRAGTNIVNLRLVGGSTGYEFMTNDQGGTLVTILNSGNVGIGTTTPAAKLSVTQGADTKLGGYMTGASDGDTRSMYMNTSGVLSFGGGDSSTGSFNTATLNAAGAWTNASDISYKENIADIIYGLDAVVKLQPRFYTMKGSDKKQIGFIAQELEQIIPEVVEGEDGSKGISYGNLNAAIVKAIQEQEMRIKQLEKKLNDLNMCVGL